MPPSRFADLDEQTLIDMLVFEAWRKGDHNSRRCFLGEALTSRWDSPSSAPDTADVGNLLRFDHEIVDAFDTCDLSDYLDDAVGVTPSRRAALRAGHEPTEAELERCRDVAVEQFFECPETYLLWHVVKLTSRTGTVAYLSQIVKGDYPCECGWVGVFRSLDAAIDAFGAYGYVNLEHYQRSRGLPGSG